MKRLAGKVAIVTDGNGAVGAACVARLHEEGARVVATGVGSINGADVVCPLDATSPESWQALIAEAVGLGGPHVFVNVAAPVQRTPFLETSPAALRALVDEHAIAGWLGMKETIPALRAAGGGYVVNVLSTFGRAPDPDAVAFSALSGGLRIATKSVALECAKQEPRVMVNAVLAGEAEPAHLSAAKASPVDVAAAVAHFSCDDGAYLAGMEIYVDGGWSLAGAR